VPDTKVEAGSSAAARRSKPRDASRAVTRSAGDLCGAGTQAARDDSGNGGGTDAAFAAQSVKPATVESFGLAGYGYHSSEEEYVELDTIEAEAVPPHPSRDGYRPRKVNDDRGAFETRPAYHPAV